MWALRGKRRGRAASGWPAWLALGALSALVLAVPAHFVLVPHRVAPGAFMGVEAAAQAHPGCHHGPGEDAASHGHRAPSRSPTRPPEGAPEPCPAMLFLAGGALSPVLAPPLVAPVLLACAPVPPPAPALHASSIPLLLIAPGLAPPSSGLLGRLESWI